LDDEQRYIPRVIRTQGLTHVHLIVSDLERSLRFYEQVFGMNEEFRDGPNMVFLTTPGSQDSITFNEQVNGPRIGAGGVDHLGFRLVDKADLDDAIRQVEDAGGRLVERGEHAPGVPFAYVSDPDGYVIEL
jgi:catechol 2,3-dioxygenase-like lactoylglutathione lyase family enzyme